MNGKIRRIESEKGVLLAQEIRRAKEEERLKEICLVAPGAEVYADVLKAVAEIEVTGPITAIEANILRAWDGLPEALKEVWR